CLIAHASSLTACEGKCLGDIALVGAGLPQSHRRATVLLMGDEPVFVSIAREVERGASAVFSIARKGREAKYGMLDLGQPSADMLVSIPNQLFPEANRDSANAGQSRHRGDDCGELAGAVRSSTRSAEPPSPRAAVSC